MITYDYLTNDLAIEDASPETCWLGLRLQECIEMANDPDTPITDYTMGWEMLMSHLKENGYELILSSMTNVMKGTTVTVNARIAMPCDCDECYADVDVDLTA